MGDLRIVYSFETQIMELNAVKAALLFQLSKRPDNAQIIAKIKSIEKDIQYHEDALQKGIGEKPRWFG